MLRYRHVAGRYFVAFKSLKQLIPGSKQFDYSKQRVVSNLKNISFQISTNFSNNIYIYNLLDTILNDEYNELKIEINEKNEGHKEIKE